MKRCLELAQQASGFVAPNPMVGCVIVHDGKIIGEGFHEKFGEAHAEVNAIRSVSDQQLLQRSILYVNLEPCSHFGKTPPCTDLIIEKKIPEAIIGCLDPNPLVAGTGAKKLQDSHIKIQSGILETESRKLNRRFFTFHQQTRPYIILKWAQTRDGFIAPGDKSRVSISNEFSKTITHRWRSEEAAIMVGTNTALHDDPQLNARLWNNHNPIRIVLDRELQLPQELSVFDHATSTIVFSETERTSENNLEFIQIDFKNDLLKNILRVLREKQIQSVLVEGGALLLQSFIDEELWDEARIFIAPSFLIDGLPSPKILRIDPDGSGNTISEKDIYGDQLIIFERKS